VGDVLLFGLLIAQWTEDLIAVSRLPCMELLLEVCVWVSSISLWFFHGNITYTHCVYAEAGAMAKGSFILLNRYAVSNY